MSDEDRERGKRLLRAIDFQEAVLKELDIPLDYLTSRENELLDAAMAVHLRALNGE